MDKFFKKLVKILGYILFGAFVLVIILLSLGTTISSIITMILKVISIAGGGSVIRGIILAPFLVVGVIQLVRGFFALIEQDSNKVVVRRKNNKHYDLSWLYSAVTFLGYLAVGLAIVFWAKSY